jgi:hypothetical protein
MEEEIRKAIYENDIPTIKKIQAKGFDMNSLSVSDTKIHF